jgi:hypothetical protein
MERTQQLTRPLSPGAQRVLTLARKRGPRGVHSSDLDVAGETADGGPPIRRLAARIDELRNTGHWFNTRKRRDRTVYYILVRDAAAAELTLRGVREPQPGPGPEPPPQLFAPPPAPPLSAVLHDAEAA